MKWLLNILKNIIKKIEQSTSVEEITDAEIDLLFGTASGTGTDAQDYVVEHGTSGIWTYRKWASGVAECWGDTTISPNFDQRISTSSYLYIASAGASVALPSGLFTSIETANANGHDNVTSNWGIFCGVKPTTTSLQINPLAWNNGGSRTITVQMFVKGLWK